MAMKRWIAVIVAAVLIFISIGINSLSYLFTRDFSGFMEEMAAGNAGYSEVVIEQGKGRDRIAVLTLDGVIQDVGSSLFASSGYNHQLFMSQLHDILNDQTIKGVVLSVNTPCGGVVESSDIYDAIKAIQNDREIPIYV